MAPSFEASFDDDFATELEKDSNAVPDVFAFSTATMGSSFHANFVDQSSFETQSAGGGAAPSFAASSFEANFVDSADFDFDDEPTPQAINPPRRGSLSKTPSDWGIIDM